MAVLRLRFCARAFSSRGKRGPLFIPVRTGLSLSRPLLPRSTGSRRAGSAVVAHRSSCSAACGILPDQGSNPCPLHWQADSQPLRHQGSPRCKLLYIEWINNKVLLYSTGNYIQYPVINHNGKEYEKGIYICITESLCCTAEMNTL